ncbi:MAG TPA: hypothetical protein VGA61_06130 [Anaerolineae bacterium]
MLTTPISWQAPTVLPVVGKATYYADGLMEQVWTYRLQVGEVNSCQECIGAVATMHAGDIGRIVWVEYDNEVWGPFIVVDCASFQDYPMLMERGMVLEVPYWLAQRWKMAGPVDVKVVGRPAHNYLE